MDRLAGVASGGAPGRMKDLVPVHHWYHSWKEERVMPSGYCKPHVGALARGSVWVGQSLG